MRDPLTIYTHFILSSSIFATLRCCFCSSVAVKRKAVTTLVGGLFERLVSTSRAFYYCYSQYKGIWWVLYDNTLALSPRGNVNYFPLTPITKWIAAAASPSTQLTTYFLLHHDQMTNSHPLPKNSRKRYPRHPNLKQIFCHSVVMELLELGTSFTLNLIRVKNAGAALIVFKCLYKCLAALSSSSCYSLISY